MNRHMQQIDHQTGEVVEGFVAYVVPKRKNGFQKGWMAMAQEAMMMLAQSNLTGNDMKVMWAMLARLDYENLIQVNPLTSLTLTSGGKAQPKAIGRLCTST